MRTKLILLAYILFSLSACNVPAQTPPSVGTASQAVTQPLVELSTSTALPTEPAPTFTPIPTLAPAPLVVHNGVYPIQFAPNATYIDVTDSIPSDATKTYSIAASKGQIMTISINQDSQGDWVYIPMKVFGADGKTLCPINVNHECDFWRGALPATQTYFVSLTPQGADAKFTMRVAINPPGVLTQKFAYDDESASLSYTDDFAPTRFSGAQVYKIDPTLALRLVDTGFYENTNLSEAYFFYGSSSDSGVAASCTDPLSFGGPEQVVGNVNINGVDFVKTEGGGVGAGNIYEQTYYRVLLNDICHEVTFFVHYGNIGNYSPDSGIKQFDQAALQQQFESVLSTLVLN